MNSIRYNIIPCPETNDHEVQILVDDIDCLGKGQMGLDPVALSKTFSESQKNQLTIGRCGCGCMGCSDILVTVSRNPKFVTWTFSDDRIFKFERSAYESFVDRFLDDTSWEDINRRIERLVSALFVGTTTKDGLNFEWASARIKKRLIHLSYSDASGQRLYDFGWDGASEELAIKQARAFKRDHFPE
ncbi:hypothetical protein GCM10011309_15340 [Litorimonas cladophorae]|uniref:Uncharacterized protein n=1 Tax=Litorimonas cladophorae TaxID=1220491 RepID=A0A918KJL3_9PROT|nr:hypothetical protein [Litorimonas cladophorae]GGX65977.1 hypothetical protein GCM10011309_15340 [Litorimonas cladophorae]